jgi:hypothetical protein
MKESCTFLKTEEKFLHIQKESVFFWIRATAAILPAEFVNCMQNSASYNTAENLN